MKYCCEEMKRLIDIGTLEYVEKNDTWWLNISEDKIGVLYCPMCGDWLGEPTDIEAKLVAVTAERDGLREQVADLECLYEFAKYADDMKSEGK